MALFKKGKKKDVEESKAPAKTFKPKERLSSVLDESTDGPALTLMRENTPFLYDEGRKAAVLLLDVMDIGGLSVKNRKDPDKGSLVELLKSDKIAYYANEPMLEDNHLALIPNAASLERMNEYSLLVKAPYTWGYVDLSVPGALYVHEVDGDEIIDGKVQPKKASFEEAHSVLRGMTDIASIISAPAAQQLGSTAVSEQSGVQAPPYGAPMYEAPQNNEEPDFSGEDVPPATNDEAPVVNEEEPPSEFDDAPPMDMMEDFEDEIPTGETDDADDLPGWDDDEEPDWGDEEEPDWDDEEAPESDPNRVVEEQEQYDALIRRYSPDDLDLEITLEEFNKVFNIERPVVSFGTSLLDDESDEAITYLNAQIAGLADSANAEIAHAHESVMQQAREQFVAQMSQVAEHAEKRMSISELDDKPTKYSQLLKEASDEFKNKTNKVEEAAAARREELRKEYERKREAEAEAAAAKARQRYEERHHGQLERDFEKVMPELRATNEAALERVNMEIMASRRVDAHRLMEAGTSRALDHASAQISEGLKEVDGLYKAWIDRIVAVLDASRKDEYARIKTLRDELDRKADITGLNEAHETELAKLRAEHDERTQENLQRLKNEQEASAKRIREIEEDHSRTLMGRDDELQQKNAKISELITTLQMKDADFLNEVDKEVKRRTEVYENNQKTADRDLKRLTRMGTALAIVLVLIALLVGVIVGVAWSPIQHSAEAYVNLPDLSPGYGVSPF